MKNKYAVKNVKTWVGREGGAYQASLYRNDKKVGTVTDDARGGEIKYCCCNDKETQLLELESKKIKNSGTYINLNVQMFVACLVDEFEEIKWIRKQCKKNIVFTLKSNKDKYCTIPLKKYSYTNPAHVKFIREQLEKHHGLNLKKIYNEKI